MYAPTVSVKSHFGQSLQQLEAEKAHKRGSKNCDPFLFGMRSPHSFESLTLTAKNPTLRFQIEQIYTGVLVEVFWPARVEIKLDEK